MTMLLFLLFLLRPICIPIPESVLLLFGLSIYSEARVFFLALCATIIGFCLMRILSEKGCGWLGRKVQFEKKLENFCRFVKIDKYKMLCLFFIVPVFPDLLVCMGAAAMKVELPKFLGIAVISKTISMGMIVFAGELAQICSIKQWQVIVLELMIVQAMSWFTKRKIRERTG